MALFAKLLIAQRAFIEELQSQIIELKNGGVIKSENFQEGQSGFRIKHDGDAEFNNGAFRGHVEANSGYMDDITIGRSAVFEGTVDSGPLYASNEIQTPSAGIIFASNTTISAIRTGLGVGSPSIDGTPLMLSVTGGFYGSTTGLTGLEFSAFSFGVGIQGIPIMGLRLKLIFASEPIITIQDTWSSGRVEGRITQTLNVGGGSTGKTLKFVNLPTAAGIYPAGTVWRDSSGYLRIV